MYTFLHVLSLFVKSILEYFLHFFEQLDTWVSGHDLFRSLDTWEPDIQQGRLGLQNIYNLIVFDLSLHWTKETRVDTLNLIWFICTETARNRNILLIQKIQNWEDNIYLMLLFYLLIKLMDKVNKAKLV